MGIDHKYNDRDAPILGFRGPTKWLSNFWPADIKFEGLIYPANENAFQAAKFPQEERLKFTVCNPREAKEMGKTTPMSELRLKEWMGGLRDMVMLQVNMEKYRAHEILRNTLIATGNAYLEETNNWGDRYWGVCGGEGENMLGRILMELRTHLKLDWKTHLYAYDERMMDNIKQCRRVA